MASFSDFITRTIFILDLEISYAFILDLEIFLTSDQLCVDY